MKTFDEYQKMAQKYSKHYDVPTTFIHLMEEVGEMTKIYSKALRRENDCFSLEEMQEMAYELGDVLATLTLFATKFGWSLEGLARMNVKKLKFREGISE